jgi:hypothetical protein
VASTIHRAIELGVTDRFGVIARAVKFQHAHAANPSADTFKPPRRRPRRNPIRCYFKCDLFKTTHIAVGSFEFDAKGNARDSRELVPLSCIAVRGLKNKVCVMTANHVTPFEAFKSFVEFYPKLGATIAFGTMAAAARMIPTSAAISDAPQIAKGPQLVSTANISSHRRRSTAHKKTPRKTSKRATGRRKAA